MLLCHLKIFSISTCFYYFCRNASNNNIIRNIFTNNSICTYNYIIPNSNTTNNFCSTTYSNIITYNRCLNTIVSYCNLLIYMTILSYFLALIIVEKPCCIINPPPISRVQIYRQSCPLRNPQVKKRHLPSLLYTTDRNSL